MSINYSFLITNHAKTVIEGPSFPLIFTNKEGIFPVGKWLDFVILTHINSIKGMSYSIKMLTDINVYIMKASEVKSNVLFAMFFL